MQLNADMGQTMTERFNVAGAMLVKIFGQLPREEEAFSDKASQVRDIGIRSAMYGRLLYTALVLVASLATALVYGAGGWLVIDGNLEVGTLVAMAALLGRLYGPLTALSNVQVDVMTALVSFDRVFEVLDLQPMVRDKRRRGRAPPRTPPPSSSSTWRSATRSAAEVSLASLESVAVLDQSEPQHGAARRQLRRPARSGGRAGRAVRRRQDDHHPPGVAAVRRPLGRGADRWARTSGT